MKFGAVKNFIITFFVLLAIYQTAKLWFEDFSSHNFFYGLFSEENNSKNDEGAFFTLESIIVNQNDGKIVRFSNDIYSSDFKPVFDNIIKITAENGDFNYSSSIDWNSILSSKSIIYKYGSPIAPSDLAMMFGFKKSIFEHIDYDIDTICIVLSAPMSEFVDVIFANNKYNKAFSFRLSNDNYIYTLYDTISSMNEKNDKGIYFVSTSQNGFDVFSKNVFIPSWNGAGFGYNSVQMVNPFEEQGSVLINRLEKNIDIFFDNPAAKWTSQVNDVYTYSDENTVLKYYTNGVLEYSRYTAFGDNTSSSFYDDYEEAISFLSKDTNIKNEYYLRRYAKDDEKTTFYFDYKIGEFPIIISDGIKNNISMSSVIEVTVTNGHVSKYKRLVFNFFLNYDYQSFVIKDFSSALDNVFEKIKSSPDTKGIIFDMYLAYEADYSKELVPLKWFIDTEKGIYIEDTDKISDF